ncbi:TPA: 30S ribosomal protein S8e [Candidatus Woesearchaeota archaeon]|nr:MAG: small subunit ribosomal protein S8e [archaeon GW2011_AR11]MBS3110904.1 30S ribosomal protein S8e [Candidatus Woesearchaeota archaeon]HIH04741.1 30S ribosomal protein S8e [Candidatus Woesearchaeota archaeon]HIH91543.1 30S ribosomal protein S8e [Candidatus Woesearchaeota archaeon]HII64585.1 30S ribosomal protein S8e [Candidatus Woesearchaeota archaeon]
MARSQRRPARKKTGAFLKDFRKKRQNELGRDPSHTKIGEKQLKSIRVIGGNRKLRLLNINMANLYDPKSKTYKKAKIINEIENPANRNFIRRNILTRGAVVETDAGKARITSRPGQDGVVNAVLV